eukprot:159236_1
MVDGTHNPLQCPVYFAMKNCYDFTEKNLNHLYECSHFKDEYKSKSICKHGLRCNAFVRLENGGNELNDRCHVQLFRHPPRNDRQIRMTGNTGTFVVNRRAKQNTMVTMQYIGVNHPLTALIKEVINNGYKKDLFVTNTTDEQYMNNEYTIMKIVEDKMDHIRHKQMGSPLTKAQMLALILYTGCDCNYDLCKSQRNGNYNKWKYFDTCLYKAISAIHGREAGCYKIYTGLNNVKLTENNMKECYFPTYVSTSWIKNVSLSFVNDNGVIIEMDKASRNALVCCDVSWISKFIDECEILISRSMYHEVERWSLDPRGSVPIGPGHG